MPTRPARPYPIFGITSPGVIVECVADPNNSNQLLFETWDGGNSTIASVARCGTRESTPAPIAGPMVRSVRFPAPSKQFVSAELIDGMRGFLWRYAQLPAETAAILIAFALATWFVDTLSAMPILYLLGDERMASLVLRLLGVLCRRGVLLADLDIRSLNSLPEGLHATLLVKQRGLSESVKKFLIASGDRHFLAARGRIQRQTFGAVALGHR